MEYLWSGRGVLLVDGRFGEVIMREPRATVD